MQSDTDQRVARIRRVVMDCLQRRNEGQTVDDQSLIERHADLMPELGEDLELLRMFDIFQRDSNDDAEDRATLDGQGSSSWPRGLHIRCPHCHQPVEILGNTSVTELTCSACGSQFSLVGEHSSADDARSIGTLGHLQLIERVGVGAFGTVWKAHDTQLDRTVAVKLPRTNHLGVEETEQFLREARAAAQLRHPNIVSVHEVGRERDRIFIVSDYVQGVTLADCLRRQQMTSREAAELCAKLADAMHHAHQSGVIHRDLKPANIMLDDQGEPHVMDFGLAKRDAGEVTMTVDGRLLGTPAYMSPEQARGESHQADHRSDVYSLGAILFELLTGELPFRGNSRMLVQQVINEEAPSPRRFDGRIPRDLETICLKCLQKDPDRRYASAEELATELRRYLLGKPILARPTPATLRAWRWARRNPIVAALSTAVALLLLVLAVVGMVSAVNQARLAERYRQLLYFSDMAGARDALDGKDTRHAMSLLLRNIPQPGQTDLRNFEWHYLVGCCQRSYQTPTLNVGKRAFVARISPDEKVLAIGGEKGTLQLWDAGSRQLLVKLPGKLHSYGRLAFSPDGRWLAAASHFGPNEAIEVWDVARERLIHTLGGHAGGVVTMAFSLDGKTIHSVSKSGALLSWDIVTGQQSARIDLESPEPLQDDHPHTWHQVVLSPQYGLLACGTVGSGVVQYLDTDSGLQGTIVIWDLETGRRRGSPLIHGPAVSALELSPDGKYLLSATGFVNVWDVSTGRLERTIGANYAAGEPHDREIADMAFSADGMMLATSSIDETIKLWDFVTGELIDIIHGHDKPIHSVTFSDKGSWLLTAAVEPVVRLWDTNELRHPRLPRAHRQLRLHSKAVRWMAFSAREDMAASAAWENGELKIWNCVSGEVLHKLSGFVVGPGKTLVFSPSGDKLASTAEGNVIRLHDPHTGQILRVLSGHGDAVSWLSFSPDGRTLASASMDKTVKLWDTDTGELIDELAGFADGVRCVAFAPLPSQRKLVLTSDTSIRCWDLKRDEIVFDQQLPSAKPIHRIAFAPNGRMIAVGSVGDDDFKIVSSSTGRVVREIGKDEIGSTVELLSDMAWGPASETIVTCGGSGNVSLWDVNTGALRFSFPMTPRPVYCVDFSPDGKTIGIGWSRITLFRAADKVQFAGTLQSSRTQLESQSPQVLTGKRGPSF